jgi:hypothetical protein
LGHQGGFPGFREPPTDRASDLRTTVCRRLPRPNADFGGTDAPVDLITVAAAVTGDAVGPPFVRTPGDRVGERLRGRSRDAQRAGLAVAAMAIAAAAVATVVLPQRSTVVPPPPPPPAHQALAAWINAETDTATVLDVPPDVRADLVRDGVAAQRLGAGGSLVVTRGGAGPGTPVARFGDGPDTLAVSRTDAATASETAACARWGRQLLDNPAVRADDPARVVLGGGQADPRALLVLAVLAARRPVHVLDLPGVPAEDAAVPRHQVVLGGLDADALAWIKAQRPPFTPLVTTAGDKTTLAWAVPAPPGLLGG